MEAVRPIKLTRVSSIPDEPTKDLKLTKAAPSELLDEDYTPTERFLHRTGARAAEYTLGLPGELANLGLSGLNYLIQKGTGQESPLPTKLPFLQTIEDVRQNITEPIAELLTGKKGSEYLKAEDPKEEFIQDVLGTGLSAVFTGGGSLLRTLGTIALGKGAAEAAKYLGGSPTTQALANVGTGLIASLYGGRSQVRNAMEKYYDTAKKAVPETTTVNPRILRQTTKRMIDDLKDRDFKGKEFIEARLKSAENLTKTNKPIPVKKLVDLEKDYNSWFGSAYGENKKRMEELVKAVQSPLKEYGKHNPQFLNNWESAKQTFSALAESRKIGEFFDQHTGLKDLAKNPLVKIGLGGIGYSLAHKALTLKAAPYIAGVGGTLLGTRELQKFFSLVSRSPQAQKIYGDLFKSAAMGNVTQAAKNIRQLDAFANKNQPKQTKPIKLTIIKRGSEKL
jgi:hypothetical protein